MCFKHEQCFRGIVQRIMENRSFFADIIPRDSHPLRIETKHIISKEPSIQNFNRERNTNSVKSNCNPAGEIRMGE